MMLLYEASRRMSVRASGANPESEVRLLREMSREVRQSNWAVTDCSIDLIESEGRESEAAREMSN